LQFLKSSTGTSTLTSTGTGTVPVLNPWQQKEKYLPVPDNLRQSGVNPSSLERNYTLPKSISGTDTGNHLFL
jgi:hypothetical protein